MTGPQVIKAALGGLGSPDPNMPSGRDIRSPTPTMSTVHQRDPSVARGRGPPSGSKASLPSLAQRTLSPQAYANSHDNLASLAARSGTPILSDASLERRPSTSYGHHRQTSVVPTARTHSRQNSSVQSPALGGVKSPPMGTMPEMGHSALPVDSFDLRSPQSTSNTTFQPLHSFSSSSTLAQNDGLSIHSSSTVESLQSTMRPSRPTTSRAESTASAATMVRRPSARPRRGHLLSASHENEKKTVGEYALHHLFEAFRAKADAKIEICVAKIPDEIQGVEQVCGVGEDCEFDALIQALGHISRHKPKHLVDIVMLWRGVKATELSEANKEWRELKTKGASEQNSGDAHLVTTHWQKLEKAEKRVSVAIFILSRILMQVYIQCDIHQIGEQLDNKIEGLIFEQIHRLDPEKVTNSSFQRGNWLIWSQLLGLVSYRNLKNVSDHFLTLLKNAHSDVGPGGNVAAANSEAKAELAVRAMSYLCIKTQPDTDWQLSVDFLLGVTKMFATSHGFHVKNAYCEVLQTLLIRVAAGSGTQLGGPRWKEVIRILNSRLSAMIAKPRYWAEGYPLTVLVLCASPPDVFANQWSSVVNNLQTKLKDRATRSVALQSICRLVWTYLHRSTDPIASMRKLEDVVRIVLPTGKKTYLSLDPAFADPTVEFIRLVGYRFPEFCFRSIIFPLLNSDIFLSGRDIRADQLEPDRMVIGIRAFLAVITDLEDAKQSYGEPPQFPAFGREEDGYDSIPRIKANPKLTEEKTNQHRMSQPVRTSTLDENIRQYYTTFCEILGKITLICDNAFGGQAALDEKFGTNGGVSTPKTPLAESFTFSRRDDHSALQEARQGFYELLHVAVQALPRFMSSHIPFNPLINLLCTGTAHVQTAIASSSANSLKAIARQNHAQKVTMGFARFIFQYDARYSTMSDEGLLGPGHIENTLQLYLELLKIWIDEIKQKTKEATASSPIDAPHKPALPLEVTSVSAMAEEIESHGIFFLCSQSRRVRLYAVQVLRLVTEFDKALSRDGPRVIHILDKDMPEVISPDDNRLTVLERSRLQKGNRKSGSHNALIDLASSDVSYDYTLWFKIFPNIIAQAFETCPFAIALGRDIVSMRLLQMRNQLTAVEEAARTAQTPTPDRPPVRFDHKQNDIFVTQWKLYLVMACTTMSNTGAQSQSQLLQHVRNKSRPAQGGENFSSARSLFAYLIPLLGSASPSVREAVVSAMGSINRLLYRPLLESLQYAVTSVNDETKVRVSAALHQRTSSTPRSRRQDNMRTETTHVYKLTSRFLQDRDFLQDEWIMNNLIRYTDDMRIFLSDTEVQNDFYFQALRQYYCGLLEAVFEGVNQTKDPSRWMSFEARKAAFTLIEDWCGYSPNQAQIAAREDSMKANAMSIHTDTNVTANIEIEKRNLRLAALSAMASLCAGPISIQMDKMRLSFDVARMLEWIDQILGDPSDKMHNIGRRAMKNLIMHNTSYPSLLERVIDRCVETDRPKAMESYFEVAYDVLMEDKDYPLHFWRILGMLIITLGLEKSQIRTKSARLLRILEKRHYPDRNSKLQNFDISVSDKTAAVYKLAQFEISRRLSKTHNELIFFVFSLFCRQLKMMRTEYSRIVIAAMLPWAQALELEVDQSGTPTQQTYMVLANMLEITTKSSTALHNEVQALWQALATGPHGGNVQLVLNFVITLCMERREQSFVDYARQIVVFLSSTPAGQKVIEFLLLQITPKNMVQAEKPIQVQPNVSGLPYVADLSEVLPIGGRQQGFSLGQLSLILLVDLMVAPVRLAPDSVPLLLQVCSVLWDHHIVLVQEQAREMLVHLIHELVISRIDEFGDKVTPMNKVEIENFVEAIRQNKPSVTWNYADNDAKDDDSEGMRVPPAMKHVTTQVINIFSLAYPDIHEQWGKVSLGWGTSCSVRHLACRSFQIFRCVFAKLDGSSLADILARLSNTVADETPEVQGFAMEILCTLKTIMEKIEARELLKYPQLFYVTCACLSTVNEKEFIEVLRMLDALLSKFNLGDPAVLKILIEAKPANWSGEFNGVMPNVYKGLKSASTMSKTLDIIIKTASLPEHKLIGKGDKFLFAVLSHLPAYLNAIETQSVDNKLYDSARTLAATAQIDGLGEIAIFLNRFATRVLSNSKEMATYIISKLAEAYFPDYQVQSLVLLMGMLSNKLSWCKLKTLDILQVIIPVIDLRSPEMISYGSDLISPLLRLLQTEYCSPALELMDLIMKRNPQPVPPENLRMSMILTGNQKIKKEYEKTKSLYGIPEESGWSVPMPAAHAKTTRDNVHQVFFSCAQLNSVSEKTHAVTPDIEFDREDDNDRAYFNMQRSNTMMSDDTHTIDEGHSSGRVEPADYAHTDLVSKLDSLDDFFDDHEAIDFGAHYAEMSSGGYGLDTETNHATHSGLYREDRPAPPVRAMTSLSRNASVSSLHNPYTADRPPLNPAIMTPGAFFNSNVAEPAAMPDSRSSSATSTGTVRPTLHSRSVTSPSHLSNQNGAAISHSTIRSVHEFLSSDTEDEITNIASTLSPTLAATLGIGIEGVSSGSSSMFYMDGESYSNGHSPQSSIGAAGLGLGPSGTLTRSGTASVKRTRSTRQAGIETKQGELLRGGRSRSKSTALRSPEVPKVPDAYLQDVKSPEL